MSEHPIIEKHLYEYNAGGYCGVFMPEKVMKKIAKLNSKYTSEVKKILSEHKDELYPADWTMATRKESEKIVDSVTIKYVSAEQEEFLGVDRRIDLFKTAKPEYVKEVYLVRDREDAQNIAEAMLEQKITKEQQND